MPDDQNHVGLSPGAVPKSGWLPALHELAIAVAAGGSVPDLLQKVAESSTVLSGAESGSLFLWDMWNAELQLAAFHKVALPDGRFQHDPGEDFARIIWERGEPLIVNGFKHRPVAGDEALSSEVRSAIGVPLRVGGYRAGVLLALRHSEGRPFGVEDELAFSLLALQAAHIVERSRANEALQASESHLRSLMQYTSDVISVLDVEGTVRYVSPSILRVMGYPPQAITGATAFGAIHPDYVESVRGLFAEVVAASGAVRAIEFQRQRRDGSWMHVEGTFHNLLDDPDVRGIVMNTRDITERKQVAEALRHQALHDALTGLPNRSLLVERLDQAIDAAEREERPLAFLKLDLDRFKQVNDSFGHQTGDQVLQQAIPRLRANLRGADTVARLGGVEFAVLLPDSGPEGAAVTARELLLALEQPFAVGDYNISLEANIGIAVYPDHGADAGTLIRNADAAVSEAARTGSRYAIYTPEAEAPAQAVAGGY